MGIVELIRRFAIFWLFLRGSFPDYGKLNLYLHNFGAIIPVKVNRILIKDGNFYE